jgi:hypothetical protein
MRIVRKILMAGIVWPYGGGAVRNPCYLLRIGRAGSPVLLAEAMMPRPSGDVSTR